jgi:hypothetical protein
LDSYLKISKIFQLDTLQIWLGISEDLFAKLASGEVAPLSYVRSFIVAKKFEITGPCIFTSGYSQFSGREQQDQSF